MANLEVRTEALSGCPYGEAIQIGGTAWNSVTTIHSISQTDSIDAIFLHFWNPGTTDVVVNLILNPNDDTVQADVDASTVEVVVPAQADLWALQGDRFRKHGDGTAYTVAAYVDAGDANTVRFTGHFDRMTEAAVTA